MNEYFQTFQNITESVEQTLKAEPNSLELKQAATRLKESVQPCLEELRLSASRLKQLVQVSLNELDRAEDVWNSKPRIAEVSKLEFWQQLGEISGREFKIPLLGSQYKSETLKQAKKSWNERYELLKKAWFFDAKGYKSKDVGAGDKQKLLQGIRFYLDEQAKDMNLMLKEGMKFIEQELAAIINLETIQYYVSFLPQQSKADSETKINMIISDIAEVFTDSANNSLDSLKKFDNFVNTTLENFENQNFGRLIILPQFTKFSEEQVITKIENIINSVFDDRVKLATQALEQAVAFYNDFLERQARYQQETPEQRQAQKAWINKQRQELVRVQYGIEAILNQSVE